MINHYPLPTKRKLPAHATLGDTANPHVSITCSRCREMLEVKVAAHKNLAANSRAKQEKAFFAADATLWQKVLNS